MRAVSVPLTLVAVLAATGCARDVGPAPFERRDSADVWIAESRAPAWGPGEGWSVGAEPLLELSAAAEGASPGSAVVVDAVRLGDGRIVIAEGTTRQLRYHSPDGDLLSAHPVPVGVLGSVSRLADDSLLVLDPAEGRLVVISPEGALARVVPLRSAPDLPFERADAFADGSVVVRTGWRSSLQDEPGVRRAPIWFLRFAPDGALVDTLATSPGDEVAGVAFGPARTFVTPLMGAVTVHAVHGRRLIVGTGERFQLFVLAREGGIEGVVRGPGGPEAVTPEELEAARAARLRTIGRSPVAERLLAQIDASLPDPTTRPAYGALLVDEPGHLWVGEYPWGGAAGRGAVSRVWTIFDPEGRMLGEVRVPEGVRLLQVGEEHLLGARRDADGSERVLLYDLVR